MIRVLHISLCIVLMACGAPKEVLTSLEQELDNSPSWIQNRPISSFDYIGIGKASKTGTMEEYQTIARRDALNDLASEIDITVTSNSLLHTLERNGLLSESFSESIVTRSNIRLEGFDITDDYENEDYYWVYYRLDKSLYAQIKAQRKTEAIERASQYLSTAQDAELQADISQAASLYVDVMRELKPYWGELNEYEGTAIDQEALARLSAMRADYSIHSGTEIVQLNAENDFNERLEFRSSLGANLTNPVMFTYRFDREERERIEIDRLSLVLSPNAKTSSLLSVMADPFKDLRKSVRREGMSFLEDLLKPEIALIEIYTTYPLVTVVTELTSSNGTESASPELRSAIIAELARVGIGVDNTGQSEYKIICKAITRDGGTSQSFRLAYTDLDIRAENEKQSTVYSTRLESIKGAHNNIVDASRLSIEKCAAKIDKNLLYPLVDRLF